MTAEDTPMLNILLNGFPEQIPEASTVLNLLERSGENLHGLIVEVNGRFIYPQRYGETPLHPGDRVEFIQVDFGG